MAKGNISLNKLRDEIDNRKQQKSGTVKGGIAPRDEFLNGLLESLYTGKETIASSLVKTVDNKVAEKKGETRKLPVQNIAQQELPPSRINEVEMSPERDELLWADIEKKRKMTLAESIENYGKTPVIGAPMQQTVNAPTGAVQLNEVYLAENVKKIVVGYLSENLGPVFEEAIKGTIIEMYAVERIKEVLHENKDLIRTVVIETIKEIQAANKKKAQS